MSRETRIQKRKLKRQRYIIIGTAVLFLLIVFGIISQINKRQKVLTASRFMITEDTTFYFFKNIDSIIIDGFNASSLSVEEGTKVNGYTPLTQSDMVINSGWINDQLNVIESLKGNEAADRWSMIVGKALQSIGTDMTETNSFVLTDIAPYAGMSQEEINARQEQIQAYNDNEARPITLNALCRVSNGYLYSTISDRRQVLNENLLPWLSIPMLNALKHVPTTNANALTIVDNDHLFAATVFEDDVVISGEERTLKLKKSFLEETETKEEQYYEMLGNRADLMRQFPTLEISAGNNKADAFFVDVKEEAGFKIVVLALKDELTGFVTRDIAAGEVVVNNIYGYEVPKSAIKANENGEPTITIMRKEYFPEQEVVSVTSSDGGKVILSVDDNPNLSDGESYKVHP